MKYILWIFRRISYLILKNFILDIKERVQITEQFTSDGQRKSSQVEAKHLTDL